MSTTDTTSRYQCEHCNGPRTKQGVHGSYCSQDCYHIHRGQKLLRNIQTDHKYCFTCGTKLKDVESPTDKALRDRDGYYSTLALQDGGGYQYRTPSADIGERNAGGAPGRELVSTGTICGECGTTAHHQEFPEVQSRFLCEYAQGLIDVLQVKREEGRHDKEINQRDFYKHLVSTGDLPLSLGRAIE